MLSKTDFLLVNFCTMEFLRAKSSGIHFFSLLFDMTEVSEILSVLVKGNLKSYTSEQIYLKKGILTSC